MNPKSIVISLLFALFAGVAGYLAGSKLSHARAASDKEAAQTEFQRQLAELEARNATALAALRAEIAARDAATHAAAVVAPPPPEPEPEPAAPETPPPYKAVKVVVVGINYDNVPDISRLQYAESDANRLADLLAEDYRFEVVRLTGAAATKQAIQDLLHRTAAGLAPDEDLLFYFAGHGKSLVNDGGGTVPRTGLLIPSDAASRGPAEWRIPVRETAIEINWVLAELLASPGRHRFAVFDCCFSGLPPGGALAATQSAQSNPLQHRSVRLISAGRANERSLEMESRKGGLFSDEFRKAVAASTGWRTLENLFAQIEGSITGNPEIVAELQGAPPIPQLRTYEGPEGDFVFIRPAHYDAWGLSHYSGIGVAEVPSAAPTPATAAPVHDALGQKDFTYAQLTAYLMKIAPPETAKQGGNPMETIFRVTKIDKVLGAEEAKRPLVPPDPEEMSHATVRAARGDPEAMAFVSLVEGQQDDPARRQLAYEWAWSALEASGNTPTASPEGSMQPMNAGELAMGMAYTEGYVGDKQPKVGGVLLQKSGYQQAVPWLATFLVGLGIKNIGEGKIKEGALSFAGALLTVAIAESGELKLAKELGDVKKDLLRRKPRFDTAAKQLTELKDKVVPYPFIGDEPKAALIETLLLAKTKCDEQDAAGTIAILDPLIAQHTTTGS